MIRKVDVVMLTKNSEHLLSKCLESIYRNVPVNRLIVVDAFSTDRTTAILDEISKQYGNVRIINDKGSRGKARQKGIQEVETDWFKFVDSDAILCEDWFKKTSIHIRKDVGAIWGIEIWSVIQNPTVLKVFLQITRKIFETRGGTHDLLVRRDAIRDIRIPENLHVFEDAYVKD
jgi:glycosyltransferase involved in cell wall biosynthesis